MPGGSVTRIAGVDRYSTAAAIAGRAFPGGAPVVYLATGESFPDGLAAGPAAAHQGGPLLLTRGGSLPGATRDALRSLAPSKVVIVGGVGAVSGAVAQAVRDALPQAVVARVAGTDRYDTAAKLAAYAFRLPPGSGIATFRTIPRSPGSSVR